MQAWMNERFWWMRGVVTAGALAVVFAVAAPAGAEKTVIPAPSGGPASYAAGCLLANGDLIEILDDGGNIVESSCEIDGDTSVCNWVEKKCVYNVARPDDGVGGPNDDGVLDGGDSGSTRPPVFDPAGGANGDGVLAGRSARQDDAREQAHHKGEKHDKSKKHHHGKKHGKHTRGRR